MLTQARFQEATLVVFGGVDVFPVRLDYFLGHILEATGDSYRFKVAQRRLCQSGIAMSKRCIGLEMRWERDFILGAGRLD